MKPENPQYLCLSKQCFTALKEQKVEQVKVIPGPSSNLGAMAIYMAEACVFLISTKTIA